MAPTIADAIWITSKNVRDCVRIGKLAQSEDDVKFLLDNFTLLCHENRYNEMALIPCYPFNTFVKQWANKTSDSLVGR